MTEQTQTPAVVEHHEQSEDLFDWIFELQVEEVKEHLAQCGKEVSDELLETVKGEIKEEQMTEIDNIIASNDLFNGDYDDEEDKEEQEESDKEYVKDEYEYDFGCAILAALEKHGIAA